jgi:hypothetical protein
MNSQDVLEPIMIFLEIWILLPGSAQILRSRPQVGFFFIGNLVTLFTFLIDISLQLT